MSHACYVCGRKDDPSLDVRPVIFRRTLRSQDTLHPVIKGERANVCYYCRETAPITGSWKHVQKPDRSSMRKIAICLIWHARNGEWVASARRGVTYFPIVTVSAKTAKAAITGMLASLECLNMSYRWADLDMYNTAEAIQNGSI